MKNEKAPAGQLPRPLQLVMIAADRLSELLRPTKSSTQPRFPNTDRPPKDQAELNERIRQAVAWGRAVLEAYGYCGPVECYIMSPDQEERQSVLWHFSNFGSQPTENHPAVYIGMPPPHLRILGYDLTGRRMGYSGLAGPDGYSTVDIALANWLQVRNTLLTHHRRMVNMGTELVAWARSQIAGFQQGALPTIHEIEGLARGACRVEITHAGQSERVDLSAMEMQMLKDFRFSGVARATRNTKKTLVDKVPALQPLIRATSENPTESMTDYRIDDAMRARIYLGGAGESEVPL